MCSQGGLSLGLIATYSCSWCQVNNFEYDLYLRSDYRTFGYTQWFYFSIENMQKGKEYRFNIVNLYKCGSLYNKGLQPLLYSSKEAAQGRGWRRTGSEILYFKSNLHGCGKKSDSTHHTLRRKSRRYKTLTFKLKFPCNNDKCWLAHSYPHTFTDLQRYLDSMMRDPTRARYVLRSNLCMTLAGIYLHLVIISPTQQL